jgi:hypothetical protein
MNNPKFTAEEVKVIKSSLSSAAVACKLGRSIPSIECKRRRLGVTGTGRAVRKSTVKQDLERHDETYWLREHTALTAKYDKLLKEQTVVERLVQRIESLAPRSYSPAPAVTVSAKKHVGRGQSAVLMFSDTHVGKNTSPTQTLSFGSYNFEIFLARLKYMENAVLSIIKNHVSTDIPELVIPMLGDFLDGTLIHSNECGQIDPIFSQFYATSHL